MWHGCGVTEGAVILLPIHGNCMVAVGHQRPEYSLIGGGQVRFNNQHSTQVYCHIVQNIVNLKIIALLKLMMNP